MMVRPHDGESVKVATTNQSTVQKEAQSKCTSEPISDSQLSHLAKKLLVLNRLMMVSPNDGGPHDGETPMTVSSNE